ncbi:MAG: hypothetical protein J5548_07415 [Prevotella sp.]|nr:hypothetical protein [Prevotella sp.]
MKQDELFRQALQRQNKRASEMKMPDDMEQRVMGRLKSKNRSHLWLRSVSIVAAACVLILLTLHYASKNVEPKEKPLTAQKTELQDGTIENGGQTSVGKEQSRTEMNHAGSEQVLSQVIEQIPTSAQKMPDDGKNKTSMVKNHSASNANSTSVVAADQLNDYIARLEAEMDALDDSVRAAHLEKIIAADSRLQQLVNRIVKDEAEQAMSELQKDSTSNYINF